MPETGYHTLQLPGSTLLEELVPSHEIRLSLTLPSRTLVSEAAELLSWGAEELGEVPLTPR